MWEVILITAGFIIVSTFYLYYKEGRSIDVALSLQFLWLAVPVLLLLSCLDRAEVSEAVDFTAYVGDGIVLGQVLAFCLYAMGIGAKKLRQVF